MNAAASISHKGGLFNAYERGGISMDINAIPILIKAIVEAGYTRQGNFCCYCSIQYHLSKNCRTYTLFRVITTVIRHCVNAVAAITGAHPPR